MLEGKTSCLHRKTTKKPGGSYWLETRRGSQMYNMVPGWLRHPPVGHCDTPTRSIRHCNDSPHKHFHIETIRPHRGRTVRPHPNRSVRPLRSGSKCWLWQSDPRTIRPILCFARQVTGQFGRRHTDGAVKKRHCATRENFTHAWVSWVQAWPNLTPNMAIPTQQNST